MKLKNNAFAFILTGIVGLVVVLSADYLYRVHQWSSPSGISLLTTLKLRSTTQIKDYKTESMYSLADRPNHWWLLYDPKGFNYLDNPVKKFTLGDAKYIHLFGDAWTELPEKYRELKVEKTIMGIGTGNETLFISPDGTYAILYAFRT